MNDIDYKSFDMVEKKDLDKKGKHKNWKGFGGKWFRTKRCLNRYLASIRRYPDAPTAETHPHLFEMNPENVGNYQGNLNVKGMYQHVEMTPEQLREYKKCMEDPVYFSETYVRIKSVDFGVIPFTLYDFQRDMVNSFSDERFTICKLPRQCGKSTTSVAFILWFALFNPGKTIGILANKGELAQEMLGRLQLSYETLPFWLQQGVDVYNKKSMKLENGSYIIATTSSGSAARGMSFSLIFLDEFAFVPPHDAEDFFRSVYPTIASGADTKMIVVSTPKGMNHFYKMWMEAKEGRSQFNPIAIHWSDIPGRDEEWKEQQIANTSEDQFRQEFNTEFIGSAMTLISPSKLAAMSYITPLRSYDKVDFYEEPKPGHRYFIAVDCARGMRLDYSAFVVIDVTTTPYKLVAKFRDNTITPMIYPQFLNNIAHYFNKAYVLIETNDVGGQVADSLFQNFEYENMLRTVSKGRAGFQLGEGSGSKLGVTTSVATKKAGCSNFKSLIETDQLIVEDFETYVEMTQFGRKNDNPDGVFAAEEGANDDLVMCMVIFSWAVASEYWKEISGADLSKEIYKKELEEREDEELPLGFQSLNTMRERIIDHHTGDVWISVDRDNIDLPDWYDDLYKGSW